MTPVITASRDAEDETGRQGDEATGRTNRTGFARPVSPSPCRPFTSLIAALLGLAAFVVYVRTLAPSIAGGDSPELIAAAYNAGVPHPTGYPLYMLVAHSFLRLCPLGSAAYRMNLLSAIAGAVAVAFLYPLMLRVSRSRIASLIATMAFAFSQMFWSQAVITDQYVIHVLGMTASLGCVLTWDARGRPRGPAPVAGRCAAESAPPPPASSRRWLFAAAFVYGLCFTHHMMSSLLAPGMLFFALTSRQRSQFLRELPRTLPLFLLPLCLYVYLPLAALRDSPTNWGDPRTWSSFLAHVTGKQYRVAMFSTSTTTVWTNLKQYTGLGATDHAGFLAMQYSLGFLWLAPLGAWSLARRRRRLFGLTLLIYLADVTYALNYNVYNADVYYLPSHLMVAIWIACGLRQLGSWLGLFWRKMALAPAKRRPLKVVLGSALLVMPLTLLSTNWSANDRHDDWSSLVYARAALDALKPNAVLLGADDALYFPLMYTRFVEHRRPDVTVLSLYDALRPERLRLTTRLASQGLVVRVPPHYVSRPGVRGDNRLLMHLIADNIDRRPVYVLSHPASLQLPEVAEAIAPYYRVISSNVPAMELSRRSPRMAVADPRPQRERRVRFGRPREHGRVGDVVEFLGYDAAPLSKGEQPWLRMSYYWRVRDPARARSARVWVVFTDPEGNYRRKADGSPEFHNIHPLAYGLGSATRRLPATLRESFDVYVPPADWNQPLQMRIAVALDEKFLPTGPDGNPWVEMGDLPVARTAARPLTSVRRNDEPGRIDAGT
jgi:hypothetical protein